MQRRPLTFANRADIAVGILAGNTGHEIGAMIDRDHTIVWREYHQNATATPPKPVATNPSTLNTKHNADAHDHKHENSTPSLYCENASSLICIVHAHPDASLVGYAKRPWTQQLLV